LHFRLSICIFAHSPELPQFFREKLSEDRYVLNLVDTPDNFLNFIEQNKEQIDCLIFSHPEKEISLLNKLQSEGILLPLIIINSENKNNSDYYYHSGEIRLTKVQLEELPSFIDQAITQFLHLAPSCSLIEKPQTPEAIKANETQAFLILQQRRLAEKLKERLGYLGVYYKRNPQYFYRNLSEEERQELIKQLNKEYREIVLNYFSQDELLNEKIDQFVNRAFFADMSVSNILEIHMELMDHFSQQLKLEGRSEEILLDYRLTLIDIIAHLCEMYRRSIPREDLPFELLFRLD
jgi:circadian clock protein KaiA